ncbi:MAG: late competence development ComFB family protein [Cellulosilyticaceae bacterium]
MENLVLYELDEVLRSYSVCRCDKCRSDIMAIALNLLPPMYVSTDKGETLLRANLLLKQQLKADILAAIIEGVNKVCNESRH